jgi:hypothetical protein
MSRKGGPHPDSAKAVEEAAYYAQEIEDGQAEVIHQAAYTANVDLRGTGHAIGEVTAADASHDTVWMRSLLVELGAWDSDFRVPLFCDNNGVVGIANGTIGLTHRNRWMRADYFHFRDFQRAGDIFVKRVHTNDNPADFFTLLVR